MAIFDISQKAVKKIYSFEETRGGRIITKPLSSLLLIFHVSDR